MTTTTVRPARTRIYKWTATPIFGASSRTVRGTDRAVSPEALRAELVSRGLAPDRIRALERFSIDRLFHREPRPTASEVAASLERLANPVGNDIPLPDAVGMVAESEPSPALGVVWHDVHRQVSASVKLHRALAGHPAVFPPTVVSVVKAGEGTAGLADALTRVARSARRLAIGLRKIRRAMLVPTISTLAALALGAGVVTWYIPMMAQMTTDISDGKLGQPLIVRALLAVSANMPWIAAGLVAAAAAGVRWWRAHKDDPGVRAWLDRVTRSRVVPRKAREVAACWAMATFCATFAPLRLSGVEVQDALRAAGDSTWSWSIHRAAHDAAAAVERSVPVPRAMEATGAFPPDVLGYVRIGSQSNDIGRMVALIGADYEAQFDEHMSTIQDLTGLVSAAAAAVILIPVLIGIIAPVTNMFNVLGTAGQ